ncbi:MAG TPA: hypothetical protein VFO63_11230 [Blastocatellia bacterium]|nr:hypothetical protein [Blastocatellia bacterium]
MADDALRAPRMRDEKDLNLKSQMKKASTSLESFSSLIPHPSSLSYRPAFGRLGLFFF